MQFHPTGIYGAGCLITEGSRGEGGYLTNSDGRALHGALRAERQGSRLARRGQPLDDHRDPRGPRRRQAQGSHRSASRASGSGGHQGAAARESPRPRAYSPTWTSTRSRFRCCRRFTTTWAAFRATCTARSVHAARTAQRSWCPGLMAVGEAACVSVHGANRLGSNSLLDLVVFGREAARHCARVVKPGAPHRALKTDCADAAPRAAGYVAPRQGLAAHRRHPLGHAAHHAKRRRGIPHRRDLERRQAQARRGVRLVRGRPGDAIDR